MTSPDAAVALVPARWGTIFGVLSLDLAQPYVPAMALQLPPDPPTFVVGLRALIEEFRALATQEPQRVFPFAQTVLDWAATQFGTPFADHLRRWGLEVFQYSGSDGVEVFLWDNIIRRGGLDGARDTAPPPDEVRLLREQLALRQPPPRGQLLPITAWDQDFYARHGYDESFNPMDMVKNTISYCNFVRAWAEMLARLDPRADLEAVQQWGMAEALRLGMPLERVGKVGQWPALPPPWRPEE